VTALVERHGLAPHPARAARFTVMVVVASPFMRETLSRALRALGATEVVEAGSLAEARVRGRGSASRDLCVVDGTLPDGSGIALVGELRQLGWSRGIVLSSVEDPYTVRAALAGGVRAFLVTPSATNGRAAGHPLPELPGQNRARGRISGADGLSGREVEVLQLVAEAGPTRTSASSWDSRLSPSRATWPGSPASSAPVTGPRWLSSPCVRASSSDRRAPPNGGIAGPDPVR
jgi:DNA-binding NarL/FixJ family response regulator